MARRGDTFTVELGNSQIAWGTYRNPTNRELIHGEGYIPIPKKYSVEFEIFNSNNVRTGLGYNEFYVSSRDGFLNNEILLAQGCSSAGDIYAKNFSIKGDLKRLGSWFAYSGASVGSRVEVEFISETEIILDII